MYAAHIGVDRLYTCTRCTLSWKRTLKNRLPPRGSRTVVCIHSLSSVRSTVREGRGSCDRTWYISCKIEYAPPFYLLFINIVHGLTPLVIVDFILSVIHDLVK